MLSRPASGETCSARYSCVVLSETRGQRGVSPSQSRQSPVALRRSRIPIPFRRLRAHHAPSAGSCRHLIGGSSIGRDAGDGQHEPEHDQAPASAARPRSPRRRSRPEARGPRAAPGPQPRPRRPLRERISAGRCAPSRSGRGVDSRRRAACAASGSRREGESGGPGCDAARRAPRRTRSASADTHARTRAGPNGNEPGRPSSSTYRSRLRRSAGGMLLKAGAEIGR